MEGVGYECFPHGVLRVTGPSPLACVFDCAVIKSRLKCSMALCRTWSLVARPAAMSAMARSIVPRSCTRGWVGHRGGWGSERAQSRACSDRRGCKTSCLASALENGAKKALGRREIKPSRLSRHTLSPVLTREEVPTLSSPSVPHRLPATPARSKKLPSQIPMDVCP